MKFKNSIKENYSGVKKNEILRDGIIFMFM